MGYCVYPLLLWWCIQGSYLQILWYRNAYVFSHHQWETNKLKVCLPKKWPHMLPFRVPQMCRNSCPSTIITFVIHKVENAVKYSKHWLLNGNFPCLSWEYTRWIMSRRYGSFFAPLKRRWLYLWLIQLVRECEWIPAQYLPLLLLVYLSPMPLFGTEDWGFRDREFVTIPSLQKTCMHGEYMELIYRRSIEQEKPIQMHKYCRMVSIHLQVRVKMCNDPHNC